MKAGVLMLSALVLIAPVFVTAWSWVCAQRAAPSSAINVWLRSRSLAPVFRLLMIAAWWALLDAKWESVYSSPAAALTLWILPVLSIAASQLLAYLASRRILAKNWAPIEVARLVFWSTVAATLPLLCVAAAFEFIYRGYVVGIFILPVAAIVLLVATAKLKSAEGFRPRRLKSGKMHGRAFYLARKLKVELERVYIVPAGRGHLTNAFQMSRSIGITDNYGEFASGPELDFVIGHELTHLKERHGRIKPAVALLLFLILTVVFFHLPDSLLPFRPLFDFVIVFGPALVLFFVSRRIEYAADRGAVKLTNDAESAIQALASLGAATKTPIQCNGIVELFMTHPPLLRRVAALAEKSKVETQTVEHIFESAGLVGMKP